MVSPQTRRTHSRASPSTCASARSLMRRTGSSPPRCRTRSSPPEGARPTSTPPREGALALFPPPQTAGLPIVVRALEDTTILRLREVHLPTVNDGECRQVPREDRLRLEVEVLALGHIDRRRRVDQELVKLPVASFRPVPTTNADPV